MQIRDRINWLVEPNNHNRWSRIYDFIMLIAIVVGILPLMFRTQNRIFWWFDLISGICFILDYILRWSTADYRLKKNNWQAFVIYPFTPMAIIDLLSILPMFNLLAPTFKVVRFSRLLKILRIFKVIRYFEPLEIVVAVIRRQSKILCTVLSLALFYIFITALIMFNAEEDINPETGKYLF
ncbi:voltage-gated potassium channel [Prevotella communis]|uniref:Voltage-gated potassium channel n=2 Tax=Prevotella communis TaxID=2913614 RepID=A0A1G8CL44_9BACT|nr:voltage-gated potassium channel [Prevotella communis]